MPVRPNGPTDARIMIITDAPSFEDMRRGDILAGGGGWELNKMLMEVGLNRGQCYCTSILKELQPDDLFCYTKTKLKKEGHRYSCIGGKWVLNSLKGNITAIQQEIALVQPSIIITLGDLSLWALTENWGIAKWRGSMLSYNGIRLLPTYSPNILYAQWDLRPIIVQDLRRAKAYQDKEWPLVEWHFSIRPSFTAALDVLQQLYLWCEIGLTSIAVDIETRAHNIACLGLAWSTKDAICIPFMQLGKPDGYWSEAEEAEIVFALYKLLTHPNCQIKGQNFLFDAQYIYRAWHFITNTPFDTMTTHHTLFSGMQKSLDFICSFHNEHYIYWKDDGKTIADDGNEEKHWRYNCEDCVRTYEAAMSLEEVATKRGLTEQVWFQNNLFKPVLKMMLRGVRVNRDLQKKQAKELEKAAAETLAWIHHVVGYPINPKSSVQMARFFYEELKLPPQKKRGAKGPTCDSASLSKLCEKQPLITPLVQKIEEWRSQQVFLNTFLTDKRDTDGRMRCSYNTSGTVTFRFSSSENVFGNGLNLQNLPKGDEV